MIYLLIYLGVGVLTLASFIYAIFIAPAPDRQDEFTGRDLAISFFALALWPAVYGMLIYDAINHAIDQRRSGNGDIVLWRRKTGVNPVVSEVIPTAPLFRTLLASPASESNDPDA